MKHIKASKQIGIITFLIKEMQSGLFCRDVTIFFLHCILSYQIK